MIRTLSCLHRSVQTKMLPGRPSLGNTEARKRRGVTLISPDYCKALKSREA